MQGAGIATAKALIEATTDAGGLSFKRRGDVRMYYRVRPRLVLWPHKSAVVLWLRVGCRAVVPSPLQCATTTAAHGAGKLLSRALAVHSPWQGFAQGR